MREGSWQLERETSSNVLHPREEEEGIVKGNFNYYYTSTTDIIAWARKLRMRPMSVVYIHTGGNY